MPHQFIRHMAEPQLKVSAFIYILILILILFLILFGFELLGKQGRKGRVLFGTQSKSDGNQTWSSCVSSTTKLKLL
jgi:hypothetical protein